MNIRVQTLERLNNNPFVRLEVARHDTVITWRTDILRNLHIQRKDIGSVLNDVSKESITQSSEFIKSYYKNSNTYNTNIYDVCVEEFL